MPLLRHERLEADHAALGELLEVVEVAGHEPAPEAEVDAARRARRRELGVERRRRRSSAACEFSGMSKNAVNPPAASAARAGREALPVRAARLVEVHVRVEAAGEDVQPGRVDLLARRRQLRLDRGDRAVGTPTSAPRARRA